ncbi:MAG: proline dehydrogenase family protein [Thermoanaerobaculia bacterium]|nr:proline dehydrogenase family protein [Thermoanaerobaculia bacterium]
MSSLFDRLVVSTLPLVPRALVHKFASRYVAGETLDDALNTIRALAAEGAMATLDVLGESVTRREQTEATRDEYIRAIEAIAKAGVPSNISIKPTAIGLNIDPKLAASNCRTILAKAKEHGMFVRLDMEDSSVTEATIALTLELFKEFKNVGIVIQAYMRRSLTDVERLTAVKMNVRLCKGIYIEPREIAYKDRQVVIDSFAALAEKLLSGGSYVGLATHDEACVQRSLAIIDRLRLSPDQYEFQMLLGVDPLLRKILISSGHRLRVYVPYGKDWYAYSTRRLKENPSIARHVVNNILGLGPASK